MYEALYQYFILHKQLSLPGIGTFLLEKKSAHNDFVNKQIYPPAFSVSLNSSGNPSSVNFFKWLAGALHISDHDAIIRFNDFLFDLKKQINEGSTIEWHGVGTLSKGLAGETIFAPAINPAVEKPVAAVKVIREKAEHMVRVGEDQKTSAEMTEMLNKPAMIRSWQWVTAFVVGIIALLFIGWHFYQEGIAVSSTSNNIKLVPMETPEP
jgi:hypothetical protein